MSLEQLQSGSKLSLQLGLATSSGATLAVSRCDLRSESVFKVAYDAK